MRFSVLFVSLLGVCLAGQRRDTSIHQTSTRKVVKEIDGDQPQLWARWEFPMPACEDGSHYTVVHGDNGEITYEEAWASCAKGGGRLAHFESAAKYQQVIDYVQKNPFINAHCAARCTLDDNACIYWVGAKTFGRDKSQWQWVSSANATSGIPIVNGWPEFPDNVHENDREANVFMFLNPDYSVEYSTFAPYKFGDYDSGPACGFICEVPNGGNLPPPPPPTGFPGTAGTPPPTLPHHTDGPTRYPPPPPLTCHNSGISQCYCDPGYTGPYCEHRVNWCDEYVDHFVDCGNDPDCTCGSDGDKALTHRMACEPHGRCLSDNDGAYCECDLGYEGPFCQRPTNQSRIFIRRCSYMAYPKAYYEDSTPLPARDRACGEGYWCVPDDLNCFDPFAGCPNYIGWCIPAQPDHTVLQYELQAMFLSIKK